MCNIPIYILEIKDIFFKSCLIYMTLNYIYINFTSAPERLNCPGSLRKKTFSKASTVLWAQPVHV